MQVGAQDKLSLFIQLGALLAGEPQRWPVGKSLSLQVVGAKQAEPWQVIHIDGWEDPEPCPAARFPGAETEPGCRVVNSTHVLRFG